MLQTNKHTDIPYFYVRKNNFAPDFLGFPGPMRSYLIKENHIGSAGSEIVWYKVTNKHIRHPATLLLPELHLLSPTQPEKNANGSQIFAIKWRIHKIRKNLFFNYGFFCFWGVWGAEPHMKIA